MSKRSAFAHGGARPGAGRGKPPHRPARSHNPGRKRPRMRLISSQASIAQALTGETVRSVVVLDNTTDSGAIMIELESGAFVEILAIDAAQGHIERLSVTVKREADNA